MNDYNKLSHTTWECKYHVVFIPKYRKKTIYGQIRKDLGDIRRNFIGQSFWAKGYCVSSVGRDEAKIREYIKHQEQNDRAFDQKTLFNQ